jgi:hypothetical protein
MSQSALSGQVISVLPGRVRLRIHPEQRHHLEDIQEHLTIQPGVRHVSVNATTGSVLVHCTHPAISCNDILGMIRDVGLVVVRAGEAVEAPPDSSSVQEVASAVGDLDRRLSAAIGRDVDLRLVAPLAIGALGVRQIVVEGLSQASGLLLLWLAYDLFVRMNRSPRGARWRSQVAAELRTTPAIGAPGV